MSGKKMSKIIIVILVLLTVPLTGCGINKADVFFPVQKDSGLSQMELLGHGWLVFQNGCLRVKPFYYFGKGSLVVWPHDYSYEVKGLEVRVLNGEGKVAARSGHWITYGGGPAANMDIVKIYIGETIDEEKYPGPYFLCSGVDD
jgi:hypothetical protein